MPAEYWVLATWIRARFVPATESQRGATLVEYALLVALIALMCAASLGYLGRVAGSKLSMVAQSVGQPT